MNEDVKMCVNHTKSGQCGRAGRLSKYYEKRLPSISVSACCVQELEMEYVDFMNNSMSTEG